MANDDNIRARGGLLPVQYPFGTYQKQYYRLTTGAAAVNVFLGMPVQADANGAVTPSFDVTGSGGVCIGSIVGFLDTEYAALPTVMETTIAGAYLPGNTDAYVLVADDPFQDFVIQEDTGGTVLARTNIFNNANMTYRSTSGDTTTGYSTIELDRSSAGTGTGGLLMLKDVLPIKNSDGTTNAPGNYCKWIVRIVRHTWAPFSSGIAGTQV